MIKESLLIQDDQLVLVDKLTLPEGAVYQGQVRKEDQAL